MDYRWKVTNTGRRSPGTRVPMVAQILRRNVHVVKSMLPSTAARPGLTPSKGGPRLASAVIANAEENREYMRKWRTANPNLVKGGRSRKRSAQANRTAARQDQTQ